MKTLVKTLVKRVWGKKEVADDRGGGFSLVAQTSSDWCSVEVHFPPGKLSKIIQTFDLFSIDPTI